VSLGCTAPAKGCPKCSTHCIRPALLRGKGGGGLAWSGVQRGARAPSATTHGVCGGPTAHAPVHVRRPPPARGRGAGGLCRGAAVAQPVGRGGGSGGRLFFLFLFRTPKTSRWSHDPTWGQPVAARTAFWGDCGRVRAPKKRIGKRTRSFIGVPGAHSSGCQEKAPYNLPPPTTWRWAEREGEAGRAAVPRSRGASRPTSAAQPAGGGPASAAAAGARGTPPRQSLAVSARGWARGRSRALALARPCPPKPLPTKAIIP
jgi:hypothetical protein